MIRRGAPPEDGQVETPRGFDDFDLKLGDVLRGERATLGKSLLDVQRELKIKANYIAAIEASDVTAFETPGFIAGYVRSYARYLAMDPEWAYRKFCEESQFGGAAGISGSHRSRPTPEAASRGAAVGQAATGGPLRTAQAQSARSRDGGNGGSAHGAGMPGPVARRGRKGANDPLINPRAPFSPGVRSNSGGGFDPGALGSVAVLVALIAGLGYGGWTVLQQVQRVTLVPVEQAPGVVAEMDPLAGVAVADDLDAEAATRRAEALDRLYRPKALDVPVMVARDGPISSLDPDRVGMLSSPSSGLDLASLQTDVYGPTRPDARLSTPFGGDALDDKARAKAAAETGETPSDPAIQVVADDVPAVELFAVRPAWVRVTGAGGTVIFEKILDTGERFTLPKTEEPPLLRAGNSGSVYFAVNGKTYGPAGPGTSVAKKVKLGVGDLQSAYQVADLDSDPALRKVIEVAEAETAAAPPLTNP